MNILASMHTLIHKHVGDSLTSPSPNAASGQGSYNYLIGYIT